MGENRNAYTVFGEKTTGESLFSLRTIILKCVLEKDGVAWLIIRTNKKFSVALNPRTHCTD
jgi:hypothetical protein